MNLLQAALKAIFEQGESKSAERRRWWRERLVQNYRAEPVSRQTLRHQLRAEQYKRFALAGDAKPARSTDPPSSRRDRRAIARALAAREYKERKSHENKDIKQEAAK